MQALLISTVWFKNEQIEHSHERVSRDWVGRNGGNAHSRAAAAEGSQWKTLTHKTASTVVADYVVSHSSHATSSYTQLLPSEYIPTNK